MAEPLLTPIEQFVIDVVRKKRMEKGWSQKKLSNYMGKSEGFIGDIENPKHRRKFSLNHVNDLANVFECSPRDFLPEKPL